MPVNFNLLGAIPQPQVIGQIPQQAGNSVGDLAGGIMGGIQQGQQIQMNNMNIQQKKQEMADQGTMREALQNLDPKDPFSGIFQAMAKTGNAQGAMTALITQQQIQESISSQKNTDLKTQREAYAAVGDISFPWLQTFQADPNSAIEWYNKYGYKEVQRFTPDAPKPGSDPKEIQAFMLGSASAAHHGMLATAAPQTLGALVPNPSQLDQQKQGQPLSGMTTQAEQGVTSPNQQQVNPQAAVMQQLAAGSETQSKTNSQENAMRQQYIGTTKDFQSVSDSYGRILASQERDVGKDGKEVPSAAGDMALVFNYMKMLDPNSTVREGEYATAKNATGVPAMVRNLYNKVQTGEFLSPEQRKDFGSRAEKLYKAQEKGYDALSEDWKKKAKASGLNPDNVIVNFKVDRSVTGEGNKPMEMPSFNSKEEFQVWYGKQSPEAQAQIRKQLGG